MKHKLLLFIGLCLCVNAYSQTPCVGGFAGEYPCNDYDLLSHVPVATLANTLGNPEGSDIWGWTDSTTGKEYAIAAMTNSTAFVDVSDPLNPIYLGRIDTQNGNTSFWRDVKIYNNHAFIVADNIGSHGMQVFDLTRLRSVSSPQTFSPDTVYNDVTSCHNIVINEANGIAYLVDCKNVGRGVHFVDISDPVNPTNLGNYNNEGVTHDAQVVTYNGPDTDYTGKEILIGSNETKIVILDVTDKNNVVKISDLAYSQLGYTHQGWFTDDQRYFLLGDEADEQNFGINTRTIVFDFQDLDNPVQSSTYSGPSTAIDHNGYVKGNEFFMASYRAGMRVLDLTNVGAATNSLSEIGYFDTFPANNGTGFNGAWSVYPYFASGNIIINDIERGLFVVRKSGTLSTSQETFRDRFSISPNPAESNPIIRSKQNEQINSVVIYNILGKKVFSKQNINQTEYVLPVENQPKGIYLVKINAIISKKLILR
ncbi:choice-of-anchor B family protein [Pseudotenacibaculum sp. MALMAid0570]|uniref:choice-of-anchor B family protein n=1 Tax=Pseudotenacibaculum sp. MALMAid0570 TaxID=3143938 RepID=UPI0032DF3EF4